jgi:hypothetical protein
MSKSSKKITNDMKAAYETLDQLRLAIMHGMAGIAAAIETMEFNAEREKARLKK